MGKKTIHHILTLTLLFTTLSNKVGTIGDKRHATIEYLPVGPIDEQRHMTVAAAAAFDPFQLCLGCKCCAANDPSHCISTSCCFGIDCNLPDKPFGVCSFVPKTCNCTACQ